jgi:hypothetical protein
VSSIISVSLVGKRTDLALLDAIIAASTLIWSFEPRSRPGLFLLTILFRAETERRPSLAVGLARKGRLSGAVLLFFLRGVLAITNCVLTLMVSRHPGVQTEAHRNGRYRPAFPYSQEMQSKKCRAQARECEDRAEKGVA